MSSIRVCLVILLCAVFPVRAQEGPPRPGEAWSLQRIDLEIEISPRKPLKMQGVATVRLEAEQSPGPSVILNSRARAVRYRKVTVNGQPARTFFYPSDGPIEVAQFTLPGAFRRGDSVEIQFATEAEMRSSQLFSGEQGAFASWVEHWYPVPASQEGGPASPAAPGKTTFILPGSWRSVANGELVSSVMRDGARVETWELKAPAARSFAAGPYVSVETVESDGRAIRFFQLKERAEAKEQAAALAKSIAAMENRFGPYPYPEYNVAEVPEEAAKGNFAASSEQGFIMVRSDVLDDRQGTVPLFAHEAAHGWWGNLVRADGPGEQMVTEALAQYGAVIAIEALEGDAAAAQFLRFSRPGYSPVQSALGYFYIWRNEKADKPLAKLGDDKWDHNLSDAKGHWFHHMLRHRVGDEVFFSTLRSLIAEWRDRQLTLDAYREAFVEAAPGDQSLSRFLAQWLDRPGAPVLEVDWWSVKRGAEIEIRVDQLQGGEAYLLPLEVEVTLADGSRVRRMLDLDETSETFVFPVAARPLDLAIDPDYRLLIWRPEYGPRPLSRKVAVDEAVPE